MNAIAGVEALEEIEVLDGPHEGLLLVRPRELRRRPSQYGGFEK